MHFEFLVEEPSIECVLLNIVPKILNPDISFAVHVFQGKQDLLNKLPNRLRGYRGWIQNDSIIVILIDKDREDCHILKKHLDDISKSSGLFTKTAPDERNSKFQVINRILIEELESWFFGDIDALSSAFPRIPKHLGTKSSYLYPDSIQNTASVLEGLLKRHGYYPAGMPKIEVANMISPFMVPEQNRSTSFQAFRTGLLACME
ncbi:MAG: DUF4276 family protein [Methanomicrobiales archaeon]|nr:DUF4276 family protein [Methanomicrobiales archaeon]